MPIVEPVIRPPAEAGSFLLQVTVGCSSNTCSFCGAYIEKKYRVKDKEEILGDIAAGARSRPRTRRVFLLDGDALSADDLLLTEVLNNLRESFPALTRVSSYANGYNISRRDITSLRNLRENRLNLIYIGLESGSRKVLERCSKSSSAEEMVRSVRRCAEAGIKSSVIVLLGLGGRKYSGQHVSETARALNLMQPAYLSFLSVMLIPGTRLHNQARKGEFIELDSREILIEARDILKNLNLERTVFRSNHASNYLPLQGRLPRDRERLLMDIERALAGDITLRPDFLRGL